MIKKILLALLLLPSAVAAHGWPIALNVPFIVAMATGANKEVMEHLADSLDFYHSRSIKCSFSIGAEQRSVTGTLSAGSGSTMDDWDEPSPLLNVDYVMPWGYKGAGDASQPFAGCKARLRVQLNYEGLSFNLCKSSTLRRKIQKMFASALAMTPCEEFYLKISQLAWTVAQSPTQPSMQEIQTTLTTLFSRLKLTPEGSTCKLYGIPVLNTPEQAGLELLLNQTPEHFAQRFVAISQKLAAVLSLVAGSPRNPERRAYMRSLLSQIDYYQETPYQLNLPKGGSVSIAFDYVGSGDPFEAFPGTTMTIEVPPTRSATTVSLPSGQETTKWEMQLQPKHEFLVRLFLLIMHRNKSPMPSYKFTEELSTLISRMKMTPRQDGKKDGTLDKLITMACAYHQYVMHHDFSEPLDDELDAPELLLQLARVAYKTYTLNQDRLFDPKTGMTLQQIADFATKHTADALRCFSATIALKEQATDHTRIRSLEKKGIRLNVGLFLKTLLSPGPGQAVHCKTGESAGFTDSDVR